MAFIVESITNWWNRLTGTTGILPVANGGSGSNNNMGLSTLTGIPVGDGAGNFTAATVTTIIVGDPGYATIQAALTAANVNGKGHVYVPAGTGTYNITTPLIIYSNTHLELDPLATIKLTSGSNCNMINNAAMTPQRTVTDAAISSTVDTTTLTSATANFTSADVGRYVNIPGAGKGVVGFTNPLTAKIVTRSNATTVILDTAAQTTVTGATCNIHTIDTNIRVSGGTWDRGTGNDGVAGPTQASLKFRFIEGLELDPDYINSASGVSMISLAAIKYFNVHDILANVLRDVVHVTGPASKGKITNIGGNSGDDGVALTISEYPEYADVAGDGVDIDVNNIHIHSNAYTIKMLGGQGTWARRISFRDIHGSSSGGGSIWIGDDANVALTTNTLIDDIVVDGVYGTVTTGYPVNLQGKQLGHVTIRNLHPAVVPNGYTSLIKIFGTDTVFASLDIEGVRYTYDYLHSIVLANGDTKKISISDVTGGYAYLVNLEDANTNVDLVQFRGLKLDMAGNGLLYAPTATQSVGRMSVHQSICDGLDWLVAINQAVPVTLVDVHLTGLKSGFAYCYGSGALTLDGGPVTTAGTVPFGMAAGGTVRVNSISIPCDVSQLTPTAGDFALNTNAGLACGTGPVISDGTHWKHLYTGTATP